MAIQIVSSIIARKQAEMRQEKTQQQQQQQRAHQMATRSNKHQPVLQPKIQHQRNENKQQMLTQYAQTSVVGEPSVIKSKHSMLLGTDNLQQMRQRKQQQKHRKQCDRIHRMETRSVKSTDGKPKVIDTKPQPQTQPFIDSTVLRRSPRLN